MLDIKNEIETLVFDADGVLLEWVANLPHYLYEKGYNAKAALKCYETYGYLDSLGELVGVDCDKLGYSIFNSYNESDYMRSLPPFCRRSLSLIPKLAKKLDHVYTCTQNAGDIVFIPNGFCHAVLNKSEVMGIVFETR